MPRKQHTNLRKKQSSKTARQLDSSICRELLTIGVAAQKGGAGKSTVSVHLAVEAATRGHQVALVDIDPQRSTKGWWSRRKASEPSLVEGTPAQLSDIQEAARARGLSLLIVDTAPAHGADIMALARVADFMLVPCRPGPLDLDAIGPTVQLVTVAKKPAAIVLNACPPGRGARESSLTREAREALASSPVPVAPVSIGQRVALSHALITGQAVTEFEPEGRAAKEFQALWSWIAETMEEKE